MTYQVDPTAMIGAHVPAGVVADAPAGTPAAAPMAAAPAPPPAGPRAEPPPFAAFANFAHGVDPGGSMSRTAAAQRAAAPPAGAAPLGDVSYQPFAPGAALATQRMLAKYYTHSRLALPRTLTGGALGGRTWGRRTRRTGSRAPSRR